jgi:hypothetical protein
VVPPPPMCQRREAFARIAEYYYRGSRQRRVDAIPQKFWLLASRALTNCQAEIEMVFQADKKNGSPPLSMAHAREILGIAIDK